MNSPIFLTSPYNVLHHLYDRLSLSLVTYQLVWELLPFIYFIIVDSHWQQSHILNGVLVSRKSFKHVLKYELLRLDNLTGSLSSSFYLIANDILLFQYGCQELFQ